MPSPNLKQDKTLRCRTYTCIFGEVVTAGGRVERTLLDGLATDELVQLLLFEVEQLIVAGRHRVDQLILHVELRHCKHCNASVPQTREIQLRSMFTLACFSLCIVVSGM